MEQLSLFEYFRADGCVNDTLRIGHCDTCNLKYRDTDKRNGIAHYKIQHPDAPCYGYHFGHRTDKGNCKGWIPIYGFYGICASCQYSNQFHYEGEYGKKLIEEPNIYCTHPKGSLNRHSALPEYVVIHKNRFDTWYQNHEYDTCDNYKKRGERKWIE